MIKKIKTNVEVLVTASGTIVLQGIIKSLKLENTFKNQMSYKP